MMANWFVQLVDSSAFEHPTLLDDAIHNWMHETARDIGRHVVWEEGTPYPSTITFSGEWPIPSFAGLWERIQPELAETEYMVFAQLGDAEMFDEPIVVHVVTKTLIATMSGPSMVQELVKQLHVVAAPAAGVLAEENSSDEA